MSWIFKEEVIAVITVILIVATILATIQIINNEIVIKPFSVLGLLNKDAKIGDYPREVVAGTPIQLNVYVENHEGKTMYYKILIKLGNETSIINEITPLNAKPILELRTVLPHNKSVFNSSKYYNLPINDKLKTCIRNVDI